MATKRKPSAPKKSAVKKTTVKKTAAKKVAKPKTRFIYNKTIDKSVRKNKLMPNYPKEERKGKISDFEVKVKRGEYLNQYGNPIYNVSVKDAKTGKYGSSKSTHLEGAIQTTIKKTGCKIKY